MFANHLQQILATQIDSNNLALAIQKDVGGDRTHAIDFGGSALPAFQVRHLRPLHAQALHGSCPCVLLVVEGYANDLKPFVLILLVGSHDVGHLLAARTAPAGPEIYEDIFSFAHIIA